jgi:hypothetical protein
MDHRLAALRDAVELCVFDLLDNVQGDICIEDYGVCVYTDGGRIVW